MKYIYYLLVNNNNQMDNYIFETIATTPGQSPQFQSEAFCPLFVQQQIDFIKINIASNANSSSKIRNAIILLLLSLFLGLLLHVRCLDTFKNDQRGEKSIESRVLQHYSKIEDSALPISINSQESIPRWYNLTPQKGTQLQYDSSKIISSQQSIIQTNNIPKPQFDAAAIIFQNNNHLNFEIVASITAEKLKLAEKLLELNVQTNDYEAFIYDFQRDYYERKYEISKYQQLPICVIVPTFNNAPNQRYKHNLQSITRQQYLNYKVIIVDDHSQDSTGQLIAQMIANRKLNRSQFTLVKNLDHMRALNSIRSAAEVFCNPEDIMMIVDGDDQLVGRQVFKLFNSVFQKQKAWFVYSNFIDSISKSVGFSRPYPENTVRTNSYRHDMFYTSHLRAFYTSLFLKIKDEDLKNNGEYFQAANDVAICIPILQMSAQRVKYIPEISYAYNSNTGSNNHFIRLFEQKENERLVRSRPQYKRLQTID